MLAWCKSFTSQIRWSRAWSMAKEKRVETQTHTRLQDTDSVERELSAHTSIIDQRSCSSSFSSEIREKNHVQTRKRSIFSCATSHALVECGKKQRETELFNLSVSVLHNLDFNVFEWSLSRFFSNFSLFVHSHNSSFGA